MFLFTKPGLIQSFFLDRFASIKIKALFLAINFVFNK